MNKFKVTFIVTIGLIIILGCFFITSSAAEPIKIGAVLPKSGNYAEHGEMELIGIYLAVEDFGGEVLGRPIELVEADDENNPDMGSRRARNLIEVEDVKFLMGGVSSSVGLAIGGVCEEEGALYLATNQNSDDFSSVGYANKYMFHVAPGMDSLVRGAAEYVAENLGKKWYFITHDYSWGHSGTKWARNMLDQVGAEEIGEIKVPNGTRDFSSYLLTIANSGADVIALTVGGLDLQALYMQMNEFGIFDKMAVWCTLGNYEDSYPLKPEQRGMYIGVEAYWKESPGMIELSNRVKEGYPNAPLSVASANTYQGWLGMTALLKGIEKAGTTDVDAVIKAMEGMVICDNLRLAPTYIRSWDHQFLGAYPFVRDLQVEGVDIFEILFTYNSKDYARGLSENPLDLTAE